MQHVCFQMNELNSYSNLLKFQTVQSGTYFFFKMNLER